MKGEIFNIFEDFVVEQFDRNAFEDLLIDCKAELITKEPFIGPGTYPDSDLYLMAAKAVGRFHLTMPILLKTLGKFALPKLAGRYPDFRQRFPSAKLALMGLNTVIHSEAKKIYRDAEPPRFTTQETAPGKVLLKYISKRKLYDFAEGLLMGLGDYYGKRVLVHRIPFNEGECDQCSFEVTFTEEDL